MADRARRVDGSTDTEVRPAEQPAIEEPRTRRLRFPSALTVLALILVAVWLASFFIPSGVYELDESGAPVPGTYRELPRCDEAAADELCVDKSLSAQFGLLWRAPPNGLYGIEDPSTRIVAADTEGVLYGAAPIFLFVLAVGAFIS